MKKFAELSVFFPAYNEEKALAQVITQAREVCKKIADKYEIIIINDGSTDNTAHICKKLMEEYPEIKTITHKPNKGYGAALKSGIYACQYQYIAFTDSDGQFDFSQITHFVPYIDQYKVVVGYRKKRSEGIMRWLNAKAWNILVNILFQLNIKDIDCAFKVFKKEVIENIPPLESKGALISTELLVKIKKAGYAIKQVPVDHLPRKGGKPTGARLDVILRAFIELGKLWKKLK